MGEIPVGFRFFPTDEQIFSHYLKKKILDPTDVTVQFVNEIDLLKFEPWDLRWQSARQREDEDWYFFWSPELYGNSRSTKKRTRNRKYCNKERFKRSTAAGYWKSTGEETEIKGYGVKRILVFHKRNRDSKTEVKTDYVMHEYDPSDIPDNKKRFVFLRLIKRNADDNLISSCRPGSKLLAPNSENNVTGIHVPEVDPQPFSGSETHGGVNRSDHIYSAPVPLPNRPEYGSSNSKRFNNDDKSVFSEHEIQTDEEDYFKDLDPLVSLTDMSSCNSIRGVCARNFGDITNAAWVKEYSLCIPENISPATL